MIEVSHLSRTYGGLHAVDDVTFTAAPGRVTGFLGPNGAGKSTTMRVMVGLTPRVLRLGHRARAAATPTCPTRAARSASSSTPPPSTPAAPAARRSASRPAPWASRPRAPTR